MNTTTVVLVTLVMATALVAQTTKVEFEKDPVGSVPAGWTARQTGSGHAIWTIERDDSAPSKSNVLKQLVVDDRTWEGLID